MENTQILWKDLVINNQIKPIESVLLDNTESYSNNLMCYFKYKVSKSSRKKNKVTKL